MIVAERTIDRYTFTYHADGTLTMKANGESTFLAPDELFCLLAFVKLENLAGRVTRHERERQREAWEKQL